MPILRKSDLDKHQRDQRDQRLSETQIERLEEILELADIFVDHLSQFEQEFIDDMRIKYKKFGEGTMISDKQWDVLERILDKCEGNKC